MGISEDLGYIDDSGYLYLSGRITQRLVRNGMPVFAADIEEQIARVKDIVAVAVVGIDDPSEGQIPVGGIVLGVGVSRDADELLELINKGLDPAQRLGAILLLERLPRNAAGKTDYVALSDYFKRQRTVD